MANGKKMKKAIIISYGNARRGKEINDLHKKLRRRKANVKNVAVKIGMIGI